MLDILNYFNNEDIIQQVNGKTFIVTGANSGLGFSVTKHLVRLGAQVIMACRNLEKGKRAKDQLLKIRPKAKLVILEYDQADFNSITGFVKEIVDKYSNFFGIVLNAGIFHPKKELKSKDGFPLTIGTNYLGIYYLLKCLQENHIWQENLERRIIFVGSLSWHKVKVSKISDILTVKRSYAIKEYAQSKTLLGSLAYQLSTHQSDLLSMPPNIKVLSMHPGVVPTNIVSNYPKCFSWVAQKVLPLFVHSADKAALGIVKLCLEKDVDENKIAVPRGLFHISGYPILRPYPKKLKYIGKELIEITELILNHLERGFYDEI